MTTFEQRPTRPSAPASQTSLESPSPESAQPAAAAGPPRSSRDRAVDLARAACLAAVVGLHVMMAGITIETNGLAITNSLAGNPIFAWSTWIVQVMPLFFVLGGFSALLAWRRQRARGVLASTYVRDRVTRLARPALLPLGLVGITLAVLGFTGLPDTVLSEVGFRIGQPLWFLAVYLGCAGLVPFMAGLHERAPRATLLGLLAAVVAVDAVVLLTAQPLIGALNLLFVWVFVQQLGFCLADGWFDWRRRWLLPVAGLSTFGVLLFLTAVVGYSTDMFDNLNPPTAAILVLGVGHVLLFAWLRPALARLAERESLTGLSNAINKNAMQIYLWHVPVIVLLTVALIIAGAHFPEPLSGEWWQSRPPFLIAVALLLIPIVIGVAWLEQRGERAEAAPVGPWLAALKVLLGIAGVVTILVAGFTPAYGAAIGVTLLLVAVLLRSPRPRRRVVNAATMDAPADRGAPQWAASSSDRSSAATPPQNS